MGRAEYNGCHVFSFKVAIPVNVYVIMKFKNALKGA